MSRRSKSLALAAGAAVLAAFPGGAVADPIQDPVLIGPNQFFVGLVNGLPSEAAIQMGCFGPLRPGETGHPLAGQTVEVQLAPGLADGFTGNASRIAATLSSPSAITAPVILGKFSSYFVAAPISTSLRLPCAGSGSVAFRPLGGGSKARPSIVKVSFAGQP